MTTLLVVDDEPDLTWAIATGFGAVGYSVLRAHSGVEALYWLGSRAVDLAIVDVRMSGMDGFELTRHLRSHPYWERLPILFLSARSDLGSKEQGFSAGGDDYLTKPFDLRELKLRVEALLQRVSSPSPTELISGEIVLDLESRCVTAKGRLITLTASEFDLLRCLLQHAGEVVTSKQLLTQGLGYPPGIGSPSTVRWHMRNLRAKLESDPHHPQYLVTIPRTGYLLDSI